jgi:Rrf2 family transcriptional regulator, iron-sulfur cluster assembly transcription factor
MQRKALDGRRQGLEARGGQNWPIYLTLGLKSDFLTLLSVGLQLPVFRRRKPAMLSPMTGYAATALAWLSMQENGPEQVRDIAQGAGVPEAYLGKIVHQLARKGLVLTQRGYGGGVIFERDPRELSLLDIAEALDDPILTPKCMLGVEDCSDERACPAHAFWKVHRAREIAYLAETTIDDIRKFEIQQTTKGTATKAGSKTAKNKSKKR